MSTHSPSFLCHSTVVAMVLTFNMIFCVLVLQVSTGAYVNQVFVVPAGNPVEDETIIGKITWNTWTRYNCAFMGNVNESKVAKYITNQYVINIPYSL